MKLAPREAIVAGSAGLVGVVGGWAAWTHTLEVAVGALILLVLGAIGLQLILLRLMSRRQWSLDRVERKLDAVARRVVTESEATGRELGGRIDALAAEIRRDV